jgi:hypothetical protein
MVFIVPTIAVYIVKYYLKLTAAEMCFLVHGGHLDCESPKTLHPQVPSAPKNK